MILVHLKFLDCFHLEFLYFPGSLRSPFSLLLLFYYIQQVFFQLQFFLDLLVLFFFTVDVTCLVESTSFVGGEDFFFPSSYKVLTQGIKSKFHKIEKNIFYIKSKKFNFFYFLYKMTSLRPRNGFEIFIEERSYDEFLKIKKIFRRRTRKKFKF